MQTNYSLCGSWKKRLAQLGEQRAAKYLSDQGYAIITTNWHAGRLGEIDLIASDGEGSLVFVEVKTRTIAGPKQDIYLLGFEAIDHNKQRRIMRCAWRFQQLNGFRMAMRFDAVAVIYHFSDHIVRRLDSLPEPIITHVPNAFAP